MEASPKLSKDGVDPSSEDLTKCRQELHNYKESYTHYLDRIAGKEGYRRGVRWTSGDHYVGEWHLNLRHGRGQHTYRNGHIYDGEWKHGKRDGHGTFWIKESTNSCYLVHKYRGNWKANLPWGTGSFYGFGGELYTGQCERGKRHGIGKQTYHDWESKDEVKYHTYYGNWVNGKRYGLGQLTMSNGNVYQGSWKNDRKDGLGVFFFKDQEAKYEGMWRDDGAVSGAYGRNDMEALPLNRWFPSVTELSHKWMKLAALQLPPAQFDVTKCRTDATVATRKFAQISVLYGSPLHGPLSNPDIPCTGIQTEN